VRSAAAGAVLGLALAVGAPAAWELTRPPTAAGAPVEQALGTPPASSSRLPTTPAAPRIPTRDASPRPAAAAPPPVRLVAPGIDVAVDPIGVSPDGQLALPEDVDRAGWYRFGPVPGGAGSAVVAGHVDDREQGLGALAPLRAIPAGAAVETTDAQGTTTRWRVVSREIIEKRALPLDRLFRRDGPPRLVLVTCGGPFRPELGRYRDNVVVVAEPVR
jgi:hypothetical protein